MENKKIGQFIKQRRKELNLSQIDLANFLSVTVPTISKWENDERIADWMNIKFGNFRSSPLYFNARDFYYLNKSNEYILLKHLEIPNNISDIKSFVFDGVTPATNKEQVFVNTSVPMPEGEPVSVKWRVYNRKGELKVIDIIIENVSLAQTARNEYTSFIAKSPNGIEGLLENLRNKVK